MKETIAVWFSCGAASAVAAKLTLERYGETHHVRIVNNPVREEDQDNLRFLRDVEKWLGRPIESATNPKYPDCSAITVWYDRRYMSGTKGAPCTTELKKRARLHWESGNHVDWHVLGFTADEATRHRRFILTERANVLPVLIDAGVTKEDCFKVLQEANIPLPRIYGLGYPNANCIGCVKATSPPTGTMSARCTLRSSKRGPSSPGRSAPASPATAKSGSSWTSSRRTPRAGA